MGKSSALLSSDATLAVVHYRKVQDVIDKLDLQSTEKNDGVR